MQEVTRDCEVIKGNNRELQSKWTNELKIYKGNPAWKLNFRFTTPQFKKYLARTAECPPSSTHEVVYLGGGGATLKSQYLP